MPEEQAPAPARDLARQMQAVGRRGAVVTEEEVPAAPTVTIHFHAEEASSAAAGGERRDRRPSATRTGWEVGPRQCEIDGRSGKPYEAGACGSTERPQNRRDEVVTAAHRAEDHHATLSSPAVLAVNEEEAGGRHEAPSGSTKH